MDVNRAALLMKMMSNTIRLKILQILSNASEGVCVNNMEQALEISQSTVSQHLAHLRNSGILTCEKKGKNVCYRLIDENVRKILKSVDIKCEE